MPKVVRMIPATKIHEFEEISPTKQRRVVGYARVSTLLEEQQSSYENQVSYFRKKAEERPDWKLIEIYTDEGITATNTKRRDGFNKMIADALDGKFDLIITKSVSRFARNTVDSISTVRLLKEHGVEVHFEKEDIWTLNSQSELLLTIMSTLAQEESRSISENTKWGIRKSFADGKARVSFSHFLGYDAGFKINEEEAKTVRLIYQLFISGYSLSTICKELERRELPTATGRQKWYISSVLSILTNEKYKGDAMLQKSYTDDFLSKKKVKNYGKVPQFYIEHHHEPIIEPALFDLVQEELRGREHNHTVSEPLCTKLRCGACNGCFGPKLWHSTDKYSKRVYQCNNKYKHDPVCHTPHLTRSEIQQICVKSIEGLGQQRMEAIQNMEGLKRIIRQSAKVEAELPELTAKRDELEHTLQAMTESLNGATVISKEASDEYNGILREYKKIVAKIDEAKKVVSTKHARDWQLNLLIETLQGLEENPQVCDERLWINIVEKAVVNSKDDIVVTFLGGIEVKVSLEE